MVYTICAYLFCELVTANTLLSSEEFFSALLWTKFWKKSYMRVLKNSRTEEYFKHSLETYIRMNTC